MKIFRRVVVVSILLVAVALNGTMTPSVSGGEGSTPFSIEGLTQKINGPGPQEAIPEIREAISQALTLLYLAEEDEAGNSVWTAERLRAIAGNLNNTPDLRRAAGRALAERLKEAGLGLDDLMNIAAQGETPEVRAAADGALVEALIAAVKAETMELTDILALVTEGGSKEVRQIAAKTVLEALKCNLIREKMQQEIENIANGEEIKVGNITIDGSISEFRQAASDFLASLYTAFPEQFKNPIEELTATASDATLTPEFRDAASRALVKYLDDSDTTVEELEEMASPGCDKIPELMRAAAGALGQRLARAFKAGEIITTDLYKLAARGTTLELGVAAVPGLTLYFSGGRKLREQGFDFASCLALAGGYCRYRPDGWIDWSGRDSDYLCSGHGYYYRFKTNCRTRYIVTLDVPWGADFDLYLVRDTSYPWGKLNGDDRVVCHSDRSGSRDEYINCNTYHNDYYFVLVLGYSGCGWYDISIKLDW